MAGAVSVEVVILVGVPAAGKSTWRRQTLDATHVVVSKDLMKNVRKRDERQAELIAAALASGRSVVVDNTSVTRSIRAPLVALTKALGARAVCVYFPVTRAVSLARNAARSGRARVRDGVIHAMATHLQPPAEDEGFDEIAVIGVAEG